MLPQLTASWKRRQEYLQNEQTAKRRRTTAHQTTATQQQHEHTTHNTDSTVDNNIKHNDDSSVQQQPPTGRNEGIIVRTRVNTKTARHNHLYTVHTNLADEQHSRGTETDHDDSNNHKPTRRRITGKQRPDEDPKVATLDKIRRQPGRMVPGLGAGNRHGDYAGSTCNLSCQH